jgi:hypothetical protein
MAADASVLKGLIRLMVPPSDQLVFGALAESTADPPFNGDRYSNLIKLAKISFAG